MKNSLEHLPLEKQTALMRIVPIIRDMCDDVEMIILFGSYARGDYREDHDLAPDRKSGAASDYDIFVVCRYKSSAANHRLWGSVSEQCNGYDVTMPYRFVVHDIKYIKERLKEIHYFFSDIVREGCLLYTSGRYELKVGRKLTVAQQLKVAQEHYGHWFTNAKGFIDHFYFEKNSLPLAAFQLHQAAESAYKALLLVYTNYCSHNHFLASMSRETREILPDMEEIFPCKTKADKELFELFDYAYIGARYDPKLKISKEELDYLSGRVKLLHELTEKFCTQRFKDLEEKNLRGRPI